MLKFKKVHPDAKVPLKATDGSAGYDLYAVGRVFINSKTVKYDTGIAFEIPKGYVGLLFPRSSVIKKGLSMGNSVGVIDSYFRDSVSAVFYVDEGDTVYDVGERVCQLVIVPAPQFELVQVDELSETERGTGGFGSTGTR